MQNLTHPALATLAGQPREDVTVEEWDTIIARLDIRILEESGLPRRRLVGARMDAIAARNLAWKKREEGLCELLSD